MDRVPWETSLSTHEATGDLLYIRPHGYEITHGKYQAVCAYQCISPIVKCTKDLMNSQNSFDSKGTFVMCLNDEWANTMDDSGFYECSSELLRMGS